MIVRLDDENIDVNDVVEDAIGAIRREDKVVYAPSLGASLRSGRNYFESRRCITPRTAPCLT